MAWSTILLIAQVMLLLVAIAGTHGWIVPLDTPTTTDFASFYAAGKLALAGHPALAYDQAAHQAAEWAATTPGVHYQFFNYPPVFLLLLAPLAALPYLLAFGVFVAGSLLLYLLALRPIVQPRGRAWLIPALGFPAVFWTVGLGQNALLSAALFAGGTYLIERRPWRGGALLGALIYKPHLGLLIPVALIAGRHWRAVGGAAMASAGLCLLSALLFGLDPWRDWLATLTSTHGIYQNGRIEPAGMVSVLGAATLLGLPAAAGYALQAASALGAAACVAVVWRGGASLPVRAATLLAGTLLAIHPVLLYDLMLLAVAGAWLLAERRDARPGESRLLVAGYTASLLCRPIGLLVSVPVAPLAAVAVLAAALRRGRRPHAVATGP